MVFSGEIHPIREVSLLQLWWVCVSPLYQLPTELRYGEYRVFPKVVDLADSTGRGRRQARKGVAPITEKEILEKIGEKPGSHAPSDR